MEPFTPGHEGLRQLARALRREMPEGFTFNYGIPYVIGDDGIIGCALGLAVVMWPEHFRPGGLLFQAPKQFNISSEVTWSIFNGYFLRKRVTQKMVANKIDKYLTSIGEPVS